MMPQLQTNNGTFFGRYWNESSLLRRYFPNDDDLSILSFGCATGEELATLRLFFPNARLCGCDIDWHSLTLARALVGTSAIVFNSTKEEIVSHGPYDIIICNSVLLSPTVMTQKGKRGIDPSLWADIVSMLDEVLKPGGILQIINSNIPFRLHPLAVHYRTLSSPLILGPHFADQFDLDGKLLCTAVTGTGMNQFLNRHLGEEGWSALEPGDLRHVHFLKQGPRQIAPVIDERLPNALPVKQSKNGIRSWASGSTAYRSEVPPDARPSSQQEIDTVWSTIGLTLVRIDRKVRRVWFDGSIVDEFSSPIDLTGLEASTFIEAITGRRSSQIAMNTLLARRNPR